MDDRPAAVNAPDGQEPVGWLSASWLLTLVMVWAINGVVVKVAVEGLDLYWAAFLRFLPSIPLVYLFVRRSGAAVRPSGREWPVLALLGVLFFVQIVTFNLGSQLTGLSEALRMPPSGAGSSRSATAGWARSTRRRRW